MPHDANQECSSSDAECGDWWNGDWTVLRYKCIGGERTVSFFAIIAVSSANHGQTHHLTIA